MNIIILQKSASLSIPEINSLPTNKTIMFDDGPH